MKPKTQDLLEIRKQLDAHVKGTKSQIIESYAKKYNVSKHTVYRWIRNEFGNKKYIEREKIIEQSIIEKIFLMKKDSIEKGNKYSKCSTQQCIDQLIQKKVPGANKLKVSTVNRRLEEIGFFLKDDKHYNAKQKIKKYEQQVRADLKNIALKLDYIRKSGLLDSLKFKDIYDYAEETFNMPLEFTFERLLRVDLDNLFEKVKK